MTEDRMMSGVKVKTRSRTRSGVASASRVGALEATVGSSIAVAGGVSAFIGLWSAVCLVSAMIAEGGPVGLVVGWFSAITGI